MGDRALNLKIEKMKTADIILYANNAKEHPEEQVDQIAASIVEFGFNDPLAVDNKNVIIEGHGRYLAAKKLGMDELPVIRLGHITEGQKKAYRLAHNKITLNSGFDFEILQAELLTIQEMGSDLALTGFSDLEIEDILKDPDFEPESSDGQGRLDEKSIVTCPNCGHKFKPER